MQHNRTDDLGALSARRSACRASNAWWSTATRARCRWCASSFPQARVYLWLHDQLNPGSKRGRRLASTAALLRELAVTVVCVSDSQRRGVEATLARIGVGAQVRALTIYNPVADALHPDGTPVDPDKLVFFSSPNKGLDFTLDAFGAVRGALPQLRLLVANPGYKADRAARRAGVEFLGALPQARVHAEVRGALCTFFPNFAHSRDLRPGICRVACPRHAGAHRRLRRGAGGARRPRARCCRCGAPIVSTSARSAGSRRLAAGAGAPRRIRRDSLTSSWSAYAPGTRARGRVSAPIRAFTCAPWRRTGASCSRAEIRVRPRAGASDPRAAHGCRARRARASCARAR